MTNGISVVQEGINLPQAHDSQKVLDSRWRYFEIAFEKKISLGIITSGRTTDIFEHKLGFLPAFDCYNIATGVYIGGTTVGGLRSSEDKVYFSGTFTDTGLSNAEVLMRIYNIPITEEYTAPIDITFPGKTSTPSKMGIKITASDFRQQELSKYTLNTQSKSLSIKKTGIAVANSGTNYQAVIRHDIGNPPTYLVAEVDPKLIYITPITPDFVMARSSANGTTLTLSGAQAVLTGSWAYIIFKELADFAI